MSTAPPFIEAPHPSGISADHRNWAMLTHLASFSNLVFPFGAILGPLVAWLVKKGESEFVDRHGKESLQFQACFLAYHMVFVCGGIVSFFGAFAVGEASGDSDLTVGLSMAVLIGLVAIALLLRLFVCVMAIVAAVRAYRGEEFRYPLTIRVM